MALKGIDKKKKGEKGGGKRKKIPIRQAGRKSSKARERSDIRPK